MADFIISIAAYGLVIFFVVIGVMLIASAGAYNDHCQRTGKTPGYKGKMGRKK